MDRSTLEMMVKPWWLSPPAFLGTLILLGLAAASAVAIEWFLDRQMTRLFEWLL